MIEVSNITKLYNGNKALNNINLTFEDGKIIGLLGENGAGKSTLLRIIADCLDKDSGSVYIDGQDVVNNPAVKENVFFLADEPFFFMNCTMKKLSSFYKDFYPNFSDGIFLSLSTTLGLDINKNISTFSKGMKRQAILIMALASRTKYILFDEIFDGIDVNARKMIKKIVPQFIADNNSTILISTHNLNEIENFADEIILFIKGNVEYKSSMDNFKEHVVKLQMAFDEIPSSNIFDKEFIQSVKQDGKLFEVIATNNEDFLISYFEKFSPLFIDSKPVSVEELFMIFMQKKGLSLGNVTYNQTFNKGGARDEKNF